MVNQNNVQNEKDLSKEQLKTKWKGGNIQLNKQGESFTK